MLHECSVQIMMIVKQLSNTKAGKHKQKNELNNFVTSIKTDGKKQKLSFKV